jgi:hypothetical protein
VHAHLSVLVSAAAAALAQPGDAGNAPAAGHLGHAQCNAVAGSALVPHVWMDVGHQEAAGSVHAHPTSMDHAAATGDAGPHHKPG